MVRLGAVLVDDAAEHDHLRVVVHGALVLVAAAVVARERFRVRARVVRARDLDPAEAGDAENPGLRVRLV